jgi:tetratricopeptide (TPR) repeat protein
MREGDAIAVRAIAADPRSYQALFARVHLLAAGGDKQQALDVLQDGCDRVVERETCLRELANLALELNDARRLSNTLDSISRAGCSTDEDCMSNLMFAAQMEWRRGNARQALMLCKKMLERSPDDDSALALEAQLAAGAGLHAESLEAFKRLAAKHPDDAQWAQGVAREREALLQPIRTRTP